MSQEMIAQVLTLMIQLLLIVAIVYLISFMKTKIEAAKYNENFTIVKTVVTSVEQTLGKGNGEDKKQEAFQLVKSLTRGKLDDEQISRLIETAVFEMNGILKKLEIDVKNKL